MAEENKTLVETNENVKPETNTTEVKAKEKVVEVKAKEVKKKKVKKPSKIKAALKDTRAELKKVTWPKFKEVVKQTGIVLVVVLVFAVVLFGLDRLCSWLTSLLIK